MVVLHYTAMQSAAAAADRLCDPAAEVSAHYLIDEGGDVAALVPETRRAWHAGAAAWGRIEDVNSHSIGIELANPGHAQGYPPYPEPQMAALEQLLEGILERWSIPPPRVVGHACIAPGRKIDPGEKFDWRRLALGGMSIWLDPDDERHVPEAAGMPELDRFRAAAGHFGYPLPDSATWCQQMHAVWQSYAMRFLPANVQDGPSLWGVAHLERLAQKWPAEPAE